MVQGKWMRLLATAIAALSRDRLSLAAPERHVAGTDAWTPRATLALATP